MATVKRVPFAVIVMFLAVLAVTVVWNLYAEQALLSEPRVQTLSTLEQA